MYSVEEQLELAAIVPLTTTKHRLIRQKTRALVIFEAKLLTLLTSFQP